LYILLLLIYNVILLPWQRLGVHVIADKDFMRYAVKGFAAKLVNHPIIMLA